MAAIITDIAVVAFIWILAAAGYRKGLVRTLYGFASFVVSAVVTALVYKPVSEWLLGLELVEKWTDSMSLYITDSLAQGTSDVMQKLPDWIWLLAGGESATFAVGDSIAALVAGILCVIVVFILVKLALTLFVGLLDAVMKLPILKSINRLGGVIFGILKGVTIIWIVCALVVLLLSTDVFDTVNEVIQSTSIAKQFYNNNVLMKFIFR